jgi:hypothetical protein
MSLSETTFQQIRDEFHRIAAVLEERIAPALEEIAKNTMPAAAEAQPPDEQTPSMTKEQFDLQAKLQAAGLDEGDLLAAIEGLEEEGIPVPMETYGLLGMEAPTKAESALEESLTLPQESLRLPQSAEPDSADLHIATRDLFGGGPR